MKGLEILLFASMAAACTAFAPVQHGHRAKQSVAFGPRGIVLVNAGGFEWEDPVEAFDQGVDNPFKNPELMNTEDGMKIDPARLLGPRLNGANLYFIGMMGSGKTAVGDVVARRKFSCDSAFSVVLSIPCRMGCVVVILIFLPWLTNAAPSVRDLVVQAWEHIIFSTLMRSLKRLLA